MASKAWFRRALASMLGMLTVGSMAAAYARDVVAGFRWFAGMPAVVATPALSASDDRGIPESTGAAVVEWALLGRLDPRTGRRPAELSGLEGQEVRIPGYIVPLDELATETSEFLLVPYVGACVHTPPPPPNQLVYVAMKGERRLPVSWWDPVWIYGTLHIDETTSAFGAAGFRLEGVRSEAYQW